MIEKMQCCGLCGVEVHDVHGFMGTDKVFCSDECAESYLSTKRPLPCPFCGHAAKVNHYGDGLVESQRWDVCCGNAKCPVNPELRGTEGNKIAALVRWNTRTEV